MANKKISELDSRASLSLSDLLAVGDPTTGYLYKITITDLKSLTGAGVVSFNGRVGAVSPAEGDYTLNQLGDAIITSPSNGQVLKYNGSNWVNAAEAGETDTLATVTARGNVTTGDIAVNGKLTIGSAFAGSSQRIEANPGAGNFDFINSSGGGFYYRWIQNGGTAMQLSTANNLLIGTTTDAGYKLDVNGTVRFTGNLTLTDNANLVTSNQFYAAATNYANSIFVGWDAGAVYLGYNMGALPIHIGTGGTGEIRFRNTGGFKVDSFTGSGSRVLVADANGVITASSSALSGFVTLDTAQTITGAKTFTQTTAVTGNLLVRANSGNIGQALVLEYGTGGTGVNALTGVAMYANAIDKLDILYTNSGTSSRIARFVGSSITNNSTREYTLPDASGTLALTSNLSSYLPLTGGTLSGNLSIVKASGSSVLTLDSGTGSTSELNFKINGTSAGLMYVNGSFFQFNNYSTYGYLFKNTAGDNIFALQDAGSAFFISSVGATLFSAPTIQVSNATSYSNIVSAATAIRTITLPDASGTVALTSQIPSLSGYVTGSGSTNTHAKFTGTNAIGNSMLSDDGTTLTSAGATRSNLYLRAASTSHYGQIAFINGSNGSFGGISYNNASQYMQFEANTSEWMRLYGNGNLRLFSSNTSDNGAKFQVEGNTRLSGTLRVNGTDAPVMALDVQVDTDKKVVLGAGYPTVSAGTYWGGMLYNGTEFRIESFLGSSTPKNIAIARSGGNVGIGVSDIVSTNLTGALTIRKSYNGDSTNGATTQAYYANQSALFLFGRNSGLSIISNNNEEGSIIFGNNSTNAYASIVTGSGGTSAGGDMYFRVGSNTERMRVRTNGNKTFNGPGGQDQMFSNYGRLSNGEYIDIDTESGGGNFQGVLIAANSYAYNAGYRTQGVYAIVGRGTTISVTTITSVNGPTGSSALSITSPSTGIIRITNVGLYGDLIGSWRGFV